MAEDAAFFLPVGIATDAETLRQAKQTSDDARGVIPVDHHPCFTFGRYKVFRMGSSHYVVATARIKLFRRHSLSAARRDAREMHSLDQANHKTALVVEDALRTGDSDG